MPKRKQCLSRELVNVRRTQAYQNLTQEIKNLRIPFMQDVCLVDGENTEIFINVYVSYWSLICLGLAEIYAKLRIYYYLDDGDPIAARCYVRIRRKKG